MPAGSLVGALAATHLVDHIGRKKTIIIAGLIWVIGSIIQCASVVRPSTFYLVRPMGDINIYSYLEPWYARSGPYHRGHICWSFQCCRAHLPIRSYCACNPRSHCFAPSMVHLSPLPFINSNELTEYIGLLHGASSSNISFNSVAPISTGPLHFEFLGVYKWFPLSSSVSEWWPFLKVHATFSIVDSESNISFHFCERIWQDLLSARARPFRY
jgi:hypothetical protein